MKCEEILAFTLINTLKGTEVQKVYHILTALGSDVANLIYAKN